MKNVKQFIKFLLLTSFAFTLCGCTQIQQTLTMGDSTMTIYQKTAYNKEKTDAYNNENETTTSNSEDVRIEKIDGQDYYVLEETENMSYSEAMKAEPSYILSSDTYFFKADAVYDESSKTAEQPDVSAAELFEKITITVTFPRPIQSTNGTLSADGCSATWEYDANAIANATSVLRYAYTGTGNVEADTAKVHERLKIVNDKKKPVIKGVKNKSTYTKKSLTFYVKDNVGIKTIKLNGKIVKLNKVKSGKYKNYYKVTSKKKGQNTVTATDLNGNKKTLKFTLKK